MVGCICLSACAPAYSSQLDLTATSQTRILAGTQASRIIESPTKTFSGSDGLRDQVDYSSPSPLPLKPTKTFVEVQAKTAVPEKPLSSPTPFPSKTAFPTGNATITRIPPTASLTSTPGEPLPTRTPLISPTIPPIQNVKPGETDQKMLLYYSQAGDTKHALAVRFGVDGDSISSPQEIPQAGLLNPNQLLVIPKTLSKTGPDGILMPDSEVVYSPSALDFDIEGFVQASPK